MKLKDCLELGKECGLSTVEECYNNVTMHYSSLFVYDDIEKEMDELHKDMISFVSSLPTNLVLDSIK